MFLFNKVQPFISDVDGKVIHLVERAPPQATLSSSGGVGVSTGGAEGGSSTNHASTSSQGAPHDRNGNSYVMLGTFNLPVNIMDPQQQIQVGGDPCIPALLCVFLCRVLWQLGFVL